VAAKKAGEKEGRMSKSWMGGRGGTAWLQTLPNLWLDATAPGGDKRVAQGLEEFLQSSLPMAQPVLGVCGLRPIAKTRRQAKRLDRDKG